MPFPISPTALSGLATGWHTYASGLPATSGGSAVVGAIVRIVKTTSGQIVGGVRRGDSTDTATDTLGASGSAWEQEFYIGVDSSQQLGVNVNSISNVTVYVMGGFTAAEAVFFQNAHNYSAAAGSGWVTNTLAPTEYGSDTPQALIILPTTAAPSKGTRQTGSTDTWQFATNGGWGGLIVGLDDNAGSFEFDWFRGTATATVPAVGYIKAGLSWDINSPIVTPASAGSYLDITAGGLPGGSVAALYGFKGTAANESGAIASSATPTPDLYEPGSVDHFGLMIGFVDGSNKVYGKVSALTNAVRRLGVFSGGAGAVPTVSSVAGQAYLGASLITGTGFGSGTNVVDIDGVIQSLGTVTSTTIAIVSIARDDGVHRIGYGAHTLTVTNSITGASIGFSIMLTPQAGGQYVNLVPPLAPIEDRPQGIPDYPGGNGEQLAGYGATGTGIFTLNPDGSFNWDPTLTGFFAELFTGGPGGIWTKAAFQVLTVKPADVTAPTIAVQPTAQSVNEGQTATFTATGAGTATLSWQAYRNGTAIPGAAGTGTAASYTTPVTVFGTDNGAQFYFVFTNTGGAVQTNTVGLTVIPTVNVTVPNLFGMTVSAAIAALLALGLRYNITIGQSGAVQTGQVFAQNPAATAAVLPNTVVTLSVCEAVLGLSIAATTTSQPFPLAGVGEVSFGMRITNAAPVTAFFKTGDSSVVADATTGTPVPPSKSRTFTVDPTHTTVAVILQSGTGTVYVGPA